MISFVVWYLESSFIEAIMHSFGIALVQHGIEAAW